MTRRLQFILGVCVLAMMMTPLLAQGGGKVDLNKATEQQLESLPGIGPAMARRILEYRTTNGGFRKIEDLMNVRGIGEKKFLKLKDLITVGGTAARPQASPGSASKPEGRTG
jgi:competence ComEA-like helix-hairpin-helix protein